MPHYKLKKVYKSIDRCASKFQKQMKHLGFNVKKKEISKEYECKNHLRRYYPADDVFISLFSKKQISLLKKR